MVLSLEIISFIVALGGLSVLLVQSYRGESLDRAMERRSSFLFTVTGICLLGSQRFCTTHQ